MKTEIEIKSAEWRKKNLSKNSVLADVTCPFAFGEWVLIDGVTSGQYIHSSTNQTHTVDINGIWGEFTLDRLKKDYNYRSANGR